MGIYENLHELFFELSPQMGIIKIKIFCIFQFILH
jgi:hypothetical protein